MKRIAIVLGTRPEVIKMSTVVMACERQGAEWFMVHTGQERSWDKGRVFSGGRGLPGAMCNLDVGSGSGRQGERAGGGGAFGNWRGGMIGE